MCGVSVRAGIQADIVVAAVGRAGMVHGDWIKPGAVVIDVGINSVDDATITKGYRLVGDCDFESCQQAASYITPVPGNSFFLPVHISHFFVGIFFVAQILVENFLLGQVIIV